MEKPTIYTRFDLLTKEKINKDYGTSDQKITRFYKHYNNNNSN